MRQMKLGLFLAPGGHHMAAWRHPDAYRDGVNIKSYLNFAEIAERGCFDLLFVADVFSFSPRAKRVDAFRLEPLTLLSALAMTTSKIGLVATATTSFNEPYNVARKLKFKDAERFMSVEWSDEPVRPFEAGIMVKSAGANPTSGEKRGDVQPIRIKVITIKMPARIIEPNITKRFK